MKLHVGPPPSDPSFHPAEEGWTPLKEPSPWMLSVMATPVCLALAAIGLVIWNNGSTAVGGATDPTTAILILLGFGALIAVHEVVHGLAYPGFGTAVNVILGVWPSKALFYACTTDAVNRERMLTVYLAPLVVLSVVPFLVDRLFSLESGVLMFVSVANALCCGGDVVVACLVASQVPAGASIRNEGWLTWWKRVAPGPEPRVD